MQTLHPESDILQERGPGESVFLASSPGDSDWEEV